jgi:hypothetical protein
LPYGWQRESTLERSAMGVKQAGGGNVSRRWVFGGAACAGLLGSLLLGWLTGLRGVMHGLLIALGSAAPVPFLIVLGVVAVVAAGSLTTALIADDSARVAAAPAGSARHDWLSRTYFEHVRRQRRHPFAWGLGSGLALGVVGIWLVLAALVIPLEARSLSSLLLAQARLDTARSGAQPRALPAGDGPLHASAWSTRAAGSGDPAVLDAFGRSVMYEPDGAGAYRLRSLGLDGRPSADDLCLRAASVPAAQPASDPLAFVESLRSEALDWSEQALAIARARCGG